MSKMRSACRDTLVNLAIISIIICSVGIYLIWKYGVEIDLYCGGFGK